MRPKLFTALCLCVALAAACLGQQKPAAAPAPPEDDEEVERVSVHLVSVPVTVTDRDGRFVTGLRAEDFLVAENGVEQRVTNFADAEQPFSVLLLLDTSGSTVIRLRDIQDSAIAFVNQLRPQDRVLPVAFDNDAVALLPGWSSDRQALAAAIRRAHTGMAVGQKDVEVVKGRDGKPVTVRHVHTRLYDAVHKATEALRAVRGRKALLLFTDGYDNASAAATRKSTLQAAEEMDALVYVVQYDRFGNFGAAPRAAREGRDAPPEPPRQQATTPASTGTRKGVTNTSPAATGAGAPPVMPVSPGGLGGQVAMRPFEQRQPKILEVEGYLKSLSEKTGGRYFRADRMEHIGQAFAAVADELRRTYSIGYSPAPLGRPGERREVKVRVGRKGLAVRSRRAYVMPAR